MAAYRKKPVLIDAWQYGVEALPDWLRERPELTFHADGSLTIATLEGEHRAHVTDWIIMGVKDELYPCKADIFALTYEEDVHG